MNGSFGTALIVVFITLPSAVGLLLCLLGFLQSDDGAVLKPVLGPSKGQREVDFYQKLFSVDCEDRALLDLRQFVAKFLGVWMTPEHPGSKSWFLSLTGSVLASALPLSIDVNVDNSALRLKIYVSASTETELLILFTGNANSAEAADACCTGCTASLQCLGQLSFLSFVGQNS